MATVENPAPYQRRIAEMEAERAAPVAEPSRQRAQVDLEKKSLQISESDVRVALRGLLDDLRHKAEKVTELRTALASQIDRVELTGNVAKSRGNHLVYRSLVAREIDKLCVSCCCFECVSGVRRGRTMKRQAKPVRGRVARRAKGQSV